VPLWFPPSFSYALPFFWLFQPSLPGISDTLYDIQLDTGNGKLVITDDVGNYILLDSSQSQIKLQNVDGSAFDMVGPVLNIKIPNQINVLTPLVDVVGNIHATGTIIDDSGNTNHHGH
jgi:hypothetical protein